MCHDEMPPHSGGIFCIIRWLKFGLYGARMGIVLIAAAIQFWK